MKETTLIAASRFCHLVADSACDKNRCKFEAVYKNKNFGWLRVLAMKVEALQSRRLLCPFKVIIISDFLPLYWLFGIGNTDLCFYVTNVSISSFKLSVYRTASLAAAFSEF